MTSDCSVLNRVNGALFDLWCFNMFKFNGSTSVTATDRGLELAFGAGPLQLLLLVLVVDLLVV